MMKDLVNRLESVLHIGYSILMELENEEPDIEKMELLYEKRYLVLEQAKEAWEESNASDQTNSQPEDGVNMDEIKELFFKLTSLEQKLNQSLDRLKTKKAAMLNRIQGFDSASSHYTQNTGQSSLFVDIKPGLN